MGSIEKLAARMIIMKYFPVLLLLSASSLVLGTEHHLKDGCPENADRNQLADYLECAATEALHTQCVTKRLSSGAHNIVPVATDRCSAICWGEDVNTLEDCPDAGARLGSGQ